MPARAILPALFVMIGLVPQATVADDITAGRDLYLNFCAECHAVDCSVTNTCSLSISLLRYILRGQCAVQEQIRWFG